MAVFAVGSAGGTGYQVDTSVLSNAAGTADSISQDIHSVAQQVGAAISVGTLGGLRIGSAVGRAEPLWTNQLSSLSGIVAGSAGNLRSTADSYCQAESAVSDSCATSQPGAS